MQHWGLEYYNAYINYDSMMTVTNFMAMSAFKLSLKGKLPGNGQKDRIFMILKIKFTRCVYPRSGHIYVYLTLTGKDVYWYISQISGERLQDHWSSGLLCKLI